MNVNANIKGHSPIKKLVPGLVLMATILIAQSFNWSYNTKSSNMPEPVCDSVPDLNKQVIAYVETKINHKVGEGECWDLAAEALNTVGAKWDNEYKFGREIDLKKECAYPGDIMQFKNIKINYKLNNTYYHETMADHTAIIYEVVEQDNFNIAEQNTSRLGQKVGITPLKLSNISSGKFKIYRPVK